MKRIHQYFVKPSTREKIGCMVAVSDDSRIVSVGVSRCNKLDYFDHEQALNIAAGRAEKALKQSASPTGQPASILSSKQYARFLVRCRKYFKNDNGYLMEVS